MASLYPEAGTLRSSLPLPLCEGILRAPRRGRAPPPVLSVQVQPPGGQKAPPTAEQVLAERGWEEPALLDRAAAARQALVASRAAGEWWHDVPTSELPSAYAVVALDGPAIDANPAPPMAAMLAQALSENPADAVVILAPPYPKPPQRAILADARARGAIVIDRLVDPWALLDRASHVYCGSGELGWLALLAGVPVHAFAPSFYSGWGLTADDRAVPEQPFARTLDEVFAAACLIATRYRDPFRNAPTTFENALAIVADWRAVDAANRGIAVCVGMSFWKRRRIADFVRSSAGTPVFRRTVAGALAAAARPAPVAPGAIAGWASRLPEGLPEAAARHGMPLVRVEDGFIRSVGLGSDFLPPASVVFDTRGMYYDPRGESDLEILLRGAAFSPSLLARAERLVTLLVARGITKYNLASDRTTLAVPAGRKCILVPGQVEDDLSIRFGTGTVRTNLDLLATVRAANPDAFVVYKPHPDVLAGHRIGAVPDGEARRFADAVVCEGSVAALLAIADELHTMTSLAGFEALLRGRRVVAYGRPFYAGWGLTDDNPQFDRGRRLTLAQLAAGALILYPRYLDPLTRLPCGPEIIIERLDDPELWRPGPIVLARRLQGMLVRRFAERRAAPSVRGGGATHLRERPRA